MPAESPARSPHIACRACGNTSLKVSKHYGFAREDPDYFTAKCAACGADVAL